MTEHPLVLGGWYGSPYSWKMRGVLRYRQIPFRWVVRDSKWDDLPEPPVRIVPVIVFPQPDGSYGEVMVDSSPQIMRLEAEFSGRSIVPTDPAVAFIDALIEDYADEWLTKAMYHYRWANDPDIQTAGRVLPAAGNRRLTSDQHEAAANMVIERQTGRRALIGSTEETAPIIESSYKRVLDVFSELFSHQEFFLGDRPGRGDFGLYGQLTQLVQRDPTPTAIAARRSPKVVSWIDDLDDLSWLPVDGDVGWSSLESLPNATTQLLHEIGFTYAPFMVANAQALMSGADEVVCDVEGGTYRQAPFNYQGKCLQWLREGHAALGDPDRARVDDLLAGTGCEVLFA